MNIVIRNEQSTEQRAVEELTREAFWNLYVEGCNEHYLVHTLRDHPDFIPELNLVALIEGEVVGNIMFTKSVLENELGKKQEVVTFGPLSVAPKYQRQGIGKTLIQHSMTRIVELGYSAIVIWGDPNVYCSSGFRSCKEYKVSVFEGRYPCALLVNALNPKALEGHEWKYHGSSAYEVNEDEVEVFDETFKPLIKSWRSSQEVFKILSQAFLDS